MLDTTAVVITVPGQETVRIGPFIAPTSAQQYAKKLRTIAAGRRLPAAIDVAPASPGPGYLDPRLPTEPWRLAELLTEQEDEHGEEVPFPDIYTRLIVQVGEDHAETLLDKATGWAGPADGDRLAELTERAEQWQHDRDQATAALKAIVVELWRAGMRNKNDLNAITSLSRSTIYAALREQGIDPTGRGEQ